MHLHFYKYQGTGNDFVLIDNRERHFTPTVSAIAHLCNRRFGIGADGLILLQHSENAKLAFEMVYYNADGNESSMCGNGGRCVVAFAKKLGMMQQECQFMAIDGVHTATIDANDWVELKMQDVTDIAMDGMDYVMNTGSPHFVRMCYDANTVAVAAEGRKVRNSAAYIEQGINVNFVSRRGHTLRVATYERGVEDETLSCGTGVTAAAIAAFLQQKLAATQFSEYGNVTDPHTTTVTTKGGDLAVRFCMQSNGSFQDIWLCGAATFVFEGFI
jgi:diaminopimelate epimerase